MKDKKSNVKEGMFGSSKLIRPGDVEALVHWLDEPRNHKNAVDAVAFAPDAKKDDAFIHFIASSPEFQGWDPSMVAHAVDKANELELMEMSKLTLEAVVEAAVRTGIKSALNEGTKPVKKFQITRTQLAEGVRKALRLALKENAPMTGAASGQMPGGAMPPPGAGAGQQMSAPTTNEGHSDGEGENRGSKTFGQIPSPEELQKALDDAGGWDMNLKGSDADAFDAAMSVAGISYHKAHTMMQTGEGMHKVLSALMSFADNTANGEYADQGEPENFESSELVQSAESLASSILDVLGWEWV